MKEIIPDEVISLEVNRTKTFPTTRSFSLFISIYINIYIHKPHSIDRAITQLDNEQMVAVTLVMRLTGLHMQTRHGENDNNRVS